MFVTMHSTVPFFRLIPEYLKTEYDVNLQQRFLLLFYICIILGLLSQWKNIDEENFENRTRNSVFGLKERKSPYVEEGKVSFRTGLLFKRFI